MGKKKTEVVIKEKSNLHVIRANDVKTSGDKVKLTDEELKEFKGHYDIIPKTKENSVDKEDKKKK